MKSFYQLCASALLFAVGCSGGQLDEVEIEELELGTASQALSSIPETRERFLTTPTGWHWYTNATEATINARIAEGFRPIDIEVVSTAPYRFAVSMVRNQGDYRRGSSHWYFDKTGDEIKALLAQHSARIVDLEIYWVGGEKRYAAVMVNDTGADDKAWWYYSQISYEDLGDKLTENSARLIDLDTYVVDGTRYFSAVMIRNTGMEAKGWWWYTNLTADGIREKLTEHRARIVDIEPRSEGRFAVVLEPVAGRHWSWHVDVDYDNLQRLIGNWGGRVADIERYTVGGATRYAVVLLNNSNPAETTTADYLRPNLESNGSFGFYLRRRGGPVLADRRSTTSVYPASTIKALQHAYAMSEVDAGRRNLTDLVTVYENASQSCADTHTGHTGVRRSLSSSLRRMMESSNNQDTNAIQEFFGGGSASTGRSRIMSFVRNEAGVGTGTQLVHKLGCGGASNNPSNLITLNDMANLYDAVAAGTLFDDDTREDFYDLMLEGRFIDAIIDAEAPAGVNTATFKAGVVMAHKAGSVPDHQSVAGWVRLPTATGNREYVYGLYTELGDANSVWTGASELLRQEIRSALATFR